MENPLEAGHEEIKHAEHVKSRRLRVVITVTILAVTMLTTLAGVAAATWAAHQSETQRSRQQVATEASEEGLHATAEENELNQQRDDRRELAWRAVQLEQTALLLKGTKLRLATVLDRQAGTTAQQSDALGRTLPDSADAYSTRNAELHTKETSLQQEARAEAQASVGWLDKHNSALAVVSIFALSLFLLGLALTIGHRSTQIGFTVIAILMTLVGGLRLLQIARTDHPVPTTECVDKYAQGDTQTNAGEYTKAAHTFEDVVAACPRYSEAWTQLAQAHLYEFGAKSPEVALDDQRHALATASVKTASLYNTLALLQALTKDNRAAADSVTTARALDPNNEIIMISEAELSAIRGDAERAKVLFDKAIDSIKGNGSYFRTPFFASIRLDELIFRVYGIQPATLTDFYTRAKQAETSLDQYGREEPGDLHGATITGVTVRAAAGLLGRAGCATFAFTGTGLRVGDKLSIRFYQYGANYEPSAGIPTVNVMTTPRTIDDITPGQFVLPLDRQNLPLPSGQQYFEIYLNGNLVVTKVFDMKKGFANDL